MSVFIRKLPKIRRRRRYIPVSRITPQIINLQTVDIIVDIPDVSTGDTTLTVVDIV